MENVCTTTEAIVNMEQAVEISTLTKFVKTQTALNKTASSDIQTPADLDQDATLTGKIFVFMLIMTIEKD